MEDHFQSNYAGGDSSNSGIQDSCNLHPRRKSFSTKTLVICEYSHFAGRDDEPYYPVNTAPDREALKRYRVLAESEGDVFFGGRLGSYPYLDLHLAIASALTSWENEIEGALAQVRDRENNS